MKVSDYIVEFLYVQGVRDVFELLGGMTTHLVDSLYRQGKINIVSMHHEQAAAFAADGLARMTGVPGIAIGTSGPGATNLLTGIGSCYFDSVPAVFITGQVNRHEMKGKRLIRQSGFQEMDIVGLAKPITKAAWQVELPEQMPEMLRDAFVLALSGRPGPVLIDIPMDIQYADIPLSAPAQIAMQPASSLDRNLVEQALDTVCSSQRPLILVGGGIQSAHASQLFRRFIEQIQVPVVNSLMAVDVLPFAHPWRVGLIGTYGNRWANMAIGQSDSLLVLGSRLDIRQTGSETEFFTQGRTIYHVDCETNEINNNVTGCTPIVADLRTFLACAVEIMEKKTVLPHDAWKTEIQDLRRRWPDTAELQGIPGINPNVFMHQLARASTLASACVVDVGQHQMWAAQSVELEEHQRFLTSGGMGAMGFALPATIGACMAKPSQPILMVAGDGGFQINIQELETVAHRQLPIKIVIFNNLCYGMVRQFQQTYFDERYQSSIWGYSTPDLAKVASAYGIPALTVNQVSELEEGLDRLWQDPQSPFLLQVMIDTFANVYPKIAFGRPITEMEPFAKPIDMEGT
jgi:acetolactate synthase-1/2/3 large subunit